MEVVINRSTKYLPIISIVSFIAFYVLFINYGSVEENFNNAPLLSLVSTIGLIILIITAILTLTIWWGKISILLLKGNKNQISKSGLVIGLLFTIMLIVTYTQAYL